ncbi:MAG: DUF3006 domain-containing protein [Halanaerobiaceae bacterium]
MVKKFLLFALLIITLLIFRLNALNNIFNYEISPETFNQKTRYTVEKIENDVVLLLKRDNENQKLFLSREKIPKEAQEGDILNSDFSIDREKTIEIKEKVQEKIEDLAE